MNGNDAIYNLEDVTEVKSVLTGLKAYFLGSSVTEGAASEKCSFVEYLSKKHGIDYVKEAVSGTTLCDIENESYIKRLERNSNYEKMDFFVCQLSTNDASRGLPLGHAASSDPKTICGAINYIIDFVKTKWNCPVFFYTGSYYEKKEYSDMVDALYEIKSLKGIEIIDLFTDKSFNEIDDEHRKLYMNDPIHPLKAGYRDWWGPFIERKLIEYFK